MNEHTKQSGVLGGTANKGCAILGIEIPNLTFVEQKRIILFLDGEYGLPSKLAISQINRKFYGNSNNNQHGHVPPTQSGICETAS